MPSGRLVGEFVILNVAMNGVISHFFDRQRLAKRRIKLLFDTLSFIRRAFMNYH